MGRAFWTCGSGGRGRGAPVTKLSLWDRAREHGSPPESTDQESRVEGPAGPTEPFTHSSCGQCGAAAAPGDRVHPGHAAAVVVPVASVLSPKARVCSAPRFAFVVLPRRSDADGHAGGRERQRLRQGQLHRHHAQGDLLGVHRRSCVLVFWETPPPHSPCTHTHTHTRAPARNKPQPTVI